MSLADALDIATREELRHGALLTFTAAGREVRVQFVLCRSLNCEEIVPSGYHPDWKHQREYCSKQCCNDVARYRELDRFPERRGAAV